MRFKRSCGILMHITSLPGKEISGTIGKEAHSFIEYLNDVGQKYWQILPINPVLSSRSYSPYDSPSTFAANSLLISIASCVDKGWIHEEEVKDSFVHADEPVIDLTKRENTFYVSMKKVFSGFGNNASIEDKNDFESYCKRESWWLDDYALFTALAEHYKTYAWSLWPKDVAQRNPHALQEQRKILNEEIRFYSFLQFVFELQWIDLKNTCHAKGIHIVGDIPIYVSFDSVDVWANPDIFMLDNETGLRNDVAGVPPDYFSPTGQLWGNPLYRWFGSDGKLKNETVSWWIKRIKRMFSFCDVIRIDHFRAFESFWAVPFGETTAVHGHWMKGPGIDFFDRMKKELGDLPLIAEDLGIINKEVEDLRDDTDLPGMKILQFAFDGSPDNHYLPCNIAESNSIVYTGTHDNDTSAGWYYSSELSRKKFVRNILNLTDDRDFHLRFVALAYSSTADLCIIPMQDIVGLGSSARMNTPGSMTGNWVWRLTREELHAAPKIELRALVHIYNRLIDDVGERNIINRYFS